MVAARKAVKATPESAIDDWQADADHEPVLLETNGTVYRLGREDAKGDSWAGGDGTRGRHVRIAALALANDVTPLTFMRAHIERLPELKLNDLS